MAVLVDEILQEQEVLVKGLGAQLKRVRNISGATVLGTGEPRIGAHGVPVIFIHPKDMGGVLVELMEIPKGAH